MAKFDIPKEPASVSKSIRFPRELADKIEKSIIGTSSTFTSFVINACKKEFK